MKIANAVTAVIVLAAIGLRIALVPMIDGAFARLAERSGIHIEYGELDIAMFQGQVRAEAVSVRFVDREDIDGQLAIGTIDADISVLSLLTGRFRFEHLWISEIEGHIDYTLVERVGTAGDGKVFTIDDFQLADIALTASVRTDRETHHGEVVIDRWHTSPLRSHLAPFDVLYRTDATGNLLGAAFTIANEGDDRGRTTRFRFHDLPTGLLAATGLPPLTWLASGTVDVSVDDYWTLDDPITVRVDYALTFSDPVVVPPPQGGRLTTLLARVLADYLSAREEPWRLAFTLDLVLEAEEAILDTSASSELADLSRIVWFAIAATMRESHPEAAASMETLVSDPGRRIRDLVERHR